MPSTITDRLNGLTTSVAVKAPCRVATTAAITLSGLQNVDGVTVEARDRVLVKDQADAVGNGIWLAQSGTWVRALDFNGSLDAVGGTLVKANEGSVNGNTFWTLGGDGALLIGTDNINWEPSSGNIDLQAALASATGTTLVSGKAPYATAVVRSLGDKVWDGITVKDFGALGNGVADDTAAIQAAIDLVTFHFGTPANLSQTGLTLAFPRGIYLVDDVQVRNTASTNNGGLNGLNLVGDQAVLKGLPASTRILFVGTETTAENISDVKLHNFQFDLSAMTTPGVGTVGLELANAYRCALHNLVFYGGPTDNTHIQFSHTGSQNALYDCHGSRFRIEGDDYGAPQLVHTTMNFLGCSWVDLLIDKAWGLNFWGTVCQHPAVAAFKMSNCDTVNIIGGDYEGAGGVFIDATGGNVSRVFSMGNRTASLTSYIVGTVSKSQLLDRNTGPDAVVYSGGRGTVGTSATTIYTIEGDPLISGSSYTSAEFAIYGDSGSAGFVDKVAVAFGGIIVVLSSNTAYGAPAARTYSFTAPYSLKLAMAAGSYQVKAVAVSSPYS